ncbi:MAG: ComEA family DNA-binding protein [Gammaproteobacteria bacterium]
MKRISPLAIALSAALLAPGLSIAGPVNVNSADAEMLARELNGIGPALAQAIVEERERNGAFSSPDDLKRVKGIGDRVIELNRENILVSDPPSK